MPKNKSDKAAEQSVGEAEQRYRAIFENNHAILLLIDPETATIVDANPAACVYYGYPRQTLTTMSITDINTLFRSEVFAEMERAKIQRRKYFCFQHRLADGSVRDVEVYSGPVNIQGKPLLYSIIHDITDRKLAEERLAASEHLLASVFDSIQDGISILNPDLTIRRVNGVMKKWYAKHLPLEGKKCHACYHDKSRPCDPCPTIRCLASGRTEREIVPGLQGSSVQWVELFSFPMKDPTSGRVTGVVEFVRDITEQKRAELVLRESEVKFRTVTEQSPNMIFINKKGRVVYCNRRCQEIMGYSAEEFYAPDFNFFALIAPESIDRIRENFQKHMTGQEVDPYEYTLLDRNGNRIEAIITTRLIPYEGEMSILGIVTDISETKRLQAQLLQAQKMEAIGTLAGGVAHDFNNLLMGIQGRTSLMQAEIDPAHPFYEHLEQIESCVRGAADLTKQLLGFARGGKYEIKPTDPNELVAENVRMFGRTKKEISIYQKYVDSPWTVEVDRSQISQVLLNIFVNAWQAMPNGGDLYIQTENVTLSEKAIPGEDMQPGRYVKVSITDTGIGMSAASLEKIFDPFYTTREKGRGTGLGLASAYGIIRNHNGWITAESEKGRGSTFTIFLPATDRIVAAPPPTRDHILPGAETVLLVDDEQMILGVGHRMLEKMGYTVITAASGIEALEVFKTRKDDIDVVVLDMIMPDLSGSDTFDQLRQLDPQVKVLLSSGYSIDGKAAEILKRGCRGFIQKPFGLQQLSQKIRSALDDN